MLTIFAMPKPFKGHIGVIQRNAMAQWTRLRPKPEILLFGNEEGVAAIAQEFGFRHIPEVNCNKYGTPLLSDLFEKAQRLASNKTVCFVNSDIMLLGDFMGSVQRMLAWRDRFMMIGIRSNVDLDEPPIYESPDQEARLLALLSKQKRPVSFFKSLGDIYGIDYFVFPRGLFRSIPDFALGRPRAELWLLWKAHASKAALVNATAVVLALHQNHDYSHHPQGKFGVDHGEEARRNRQLADGHGFGIEDATYRITAKGKIKYNFWHYTRVMRESYWAFLKFTGPVRHPLGLRQENIAKMLTFWSR